MVEQTRRGMMKLRANSAMQRCAARVPLINVAEAPPKTTIEAGFIARTICDALVAALDRHGVAAEGRDTLLLGYGAIGAAIADVLVQGLGWPKSRIRVLDTAVDAQERAAEAGLASWNRDQAPRRFGLVIGCTGTTSFGVGDWVHLDDGAILASASSGSAELSREQFIEMADVHEEDDVFLEHRDSLRQRSIHDEIKVHVVDRTVVFLNGGFPINFTGGVNSTPPSLIQLTRAMMLGGAIQAMCAPKPGLMPLDPALCSWISEQFRELTKH
jgi:S-adenosylhomocysteine hydrolase